jgi:hypothetical protein
MTTPLLPGATLPYRAFSPAFQVDCLSYFATECRLISDLECQGDEEVDQGLHKEDG